MANAKRSESAKKSSAEADSIAALRERGAGAVEARYFGFMESNGDKLVSDKVYGLFLDKQGDKQYAVAALYGSRESSKLSTSSKGSGLSLAQARKELAWACRDRLKKLYKEYDDCDDLAKADAGDGFPLTTTMAAKLPAFINDGFARPGRAKVWGVAESEMARILSECGGDLIYCEIAMFPTSKIREVALECARELDGEPLEYNANGEGSCFMLGMWEGAPDGMSMLGVFDASPAGLEEYPMEALADRHGGLLIANTGNDNSGAESLQELASFLDERVWEPLGKEAAEKHSEKVCLGIESLMDWVDAQSRGAALADPQMQQALGRARSSRVARELDAVAGKARAPSRPKSI